MFSLIWGTKQIQNGRRVTNYKTEVAIASTLVNKLNSEGITYIYSIHRMNLKAKLALENAGLRNEEFPDKWTWSRA